VRPPLYACVATLLLGILFAACGNERNHPTGLAALGPPTNFISYSSSSGDVSFGRPSTWSVSSGRFPEVAQISSGRAVAVVYSYPRTDLPTDPAGVEASRRRLLASLHNREPSFEVGRTRIFEVDDAPAVEIVGRGTIAGHAVKSRTVHVYKGAAEYVIDAYSNPSSFQRANRIAFEPLIATIRLGGVPEGVR
jgi:hypothetical protein